MNNLLKNDNKKKPQQKQNSEISSTGNQNQSDQNSEIRIKETNLLITCQFMDSEIKFCSKIIFISFYYQSCVPRGNMMIVKVKLIIFFSFSIMGKFYRILCFCNLVFLSFWNQI